MRNLIYIALVLAPFTVKSQDVQEILQKMQKTYAQADSYSMDVQVQVKHQGNRVNNYKGRSFKNGDKYHIEMMNRTTILNEDYLLSVDHIARNIILRERAEQNQIAQYDPSVQADSIVLNKNIRVELTKSAAVDRYKLVCHYKDHPQFETVELEVRKKDFALLGYHTTMTSRYQDQCDRVEIYYSNVRLNTRIKSDVFSEKKYVAVSAKELKGTGDYKNYEVIDQRKESK